MTATKKTLTLSCLLAALPAAAVAQGGVVFQKGFARPDTLLANDFATYHPEAAGARQSADWLVQSGSLFSVGKAAWTGYPDDREPDALSKTGTRSAALRVVSRRADVGDAAVTFQLYNQGLVHSPGLPASPHDGVTVWLRYQEDGSLYAVSVSRRDDTLTIQKKTGGQYVDLIPAVKLKARYDKWQRVTVAARNTPGGPVALEVWVAGKPVAQAYDGDVGGPALRQAGRVGLRGDNCEFLFDDFKIAPLAALASFGAEGDHP